MGPMTLRAVGTAFAAALLGLALALPANASQRFFPTPEAAVDALHAALRAADTRALLAIFGTEHGALVTTGDPAEDRDMYADSRAKLDTWRMLDAVGPDRRILSIGAEAWPFPIPLVREAAGWRFASEEGEDELLNRRIGTGELDALEVMRAYPDAQDEYARRDRNGDGVREYAMRLGSTPGTRDGLYWPDPTDGSERSPFGPLVAESGVDAATHKQGGAFQGYRYRVLTSQGPGARGGAYDYVIGGRMVAGYALLAWPAAYGNTGIMSFIVNRDGTIYERDLGADTEWAAAAITSFDPTGWREVVPEAERMAQAAAPPGQ